MHHANNRSHVEPVVRELKLRRVKARYRAVQIQRLRAAKRIAKVEGKLMKGHRRVAEHKRRGGRGGHANTVSDTSRLTLGVHDWRSRQLSVVYQHGTRLRRQERLWFFFGIFFGREHASPVPLHQKN